MLSVVEPPWNSNEVEGVVEGGGEWLRISEKIFLPMKVPGREYLGWLVFGDEELASNYSMVPGTCNWGDKTLVISFVWCFLAADSFFFKES